MLFVIKYVKVVLASKGRFPTSAYRAHFPEPKYRSGGWRSAGPAIGRTHLAVLWFSGGNFWANARHSFRRSLTCQALKASSRCCRVSRTSRHSEWRSAIPILLHDPSRSLIATLEDFHHRANRLKDPLSGTRNKIRLDSKRYELTLKLCSLLSCWSTGHRQTSQICGIRHPFSVLFLST